MLRVLRQQNIASDYCATYPITRVTYKYLESPYDDADRIEVFLRITYLFLEAYKRCF